jgi:hypothetical protein
MAYSLNQSKAKEWTRRLSQASLAGYLHGGGFLIVYIGSHFAHDQQSSDTAVTVGNICIAIAVRWGSRRPRFVAWTSSGVLAHDFLLGAQLFFEYFSLPILEDMGD